MMLIRRTGGSWREPETTSYANEKELQDLVKASSTLLPDTPPSAVVDEFWIPEVGGSVDLVVVDPQGELTLVECKLRANREIRREVVGQILAYAGGLWRMSYDEFAAGFAARAGQPLDRAVAQVAGDDMDMDQFRASVTQRLADGEFRLVIVVDVITTELKRIVEYLNEHTVSSVQVLALELGYIKDGDVELLVPTVYGQESAARKVKATAWTAEAFGRVQQRIAGPALTFTERLLAHGREHGHHAVYGSGATPSVTYHYILGGQAVAVWTLYLRTAGPTVSLSFGVFSKRFPGRALDFLRELRAEPALNAELADVDEADLNKWPAIVVEGVLTAPVAQEAFLAALDRLTATEPAE
jgi:hypothetical protein